MIVKTYKIKLKKNINIEPINNFFNENGFSYSSFIADNEGEALLSAWVCAQDDISAGLMYDKKRKEAIMSIGGKDSFYAMFEAVFNMEFDTSQSVKIDESLTLDDVL
jgi:hypothetical protein